MHCSNEESKCSHKFYKIPKSQSHVPKCSECGCNMRPHSMLFDEAYNDQFYKVSTVRELMVKCDAIIVAGTALETTLAR